MSFAFHQFSSLTLGRQFAWTEGFVAASLIRDTWAPDPAPVFLTDIPATHRPRPKVQVQGRALIDGAADCFDIAFPKVPDEGFNYIGAVLFTDTGVEDTSRLLVYVNAGTGWPLSPNGGNVIIRPDPGPNKLFRIGEYPA
jgi:hypothetical protein